jgi:sec-independent protein translocase protein TatA
VSLPGGWELVLVVLVIMVLFGAKRLPEASRSLGRSLRIFKAETKGLRDDSDSIIGSGDSDSDTTVTARQEPLPPADPPQQPRA